MHYTLGLVVVFLCVASAYSVEEDTIVDFEKRDCDAMMLCNLTEAVPGSDVKFNEFQREEKIRVCRSLKSSHDCSTLYSCKRMAKFVVLVDRFYNVVCKKILTDNGISTENCYKSAHLKAVSKCSNHLAKMKSLAYETEGKEAVRVACCEHHNYSNCYRDEVSSACSMDRSSVVVQPDPNFDRFCHQWTPKQCREQRDLKPNSMGVSSSESIRSGIIPVVIALLGVCVVGRH
ncbi:uncharacterized protein LOC100900478 [Galendromus occidentalis]|uniref:Uncharacterized protein LOC100900478 n=1 Tax=Galendromus occidentalis TaxID=34638 RepID=A0AAJ6QPF3_9ACAR|nr:uncharacterized protein LOC100900478 [Galendromus occidentalis]